MSSIERICSIDPTRHDIREPFLIECEGAIWRVATDGRCLFAVKASGGAIEMPHPYAASVARMLSDWPAGVEEDRASLAAWLGSPGWAYTCAACGHMHPEDTTRRMVLLRGWYGDGRLVARVLDCALAGKLWLDVIDATTYPCLRLRGEDWRGLVMGLRPDFAMATVQKRWPEVTP
jgi:hypothetical protein